MAWHLLPTIFAYFHSCDPLAVPRYRTAEGDAVAHIRERRDRVSFMATYPISYRTHNEDIGRRFGVGNMGGQHQEQYSRVDFRPLYGR